MATVKITGCGLSLNQDYQFWGDLWEEGDCWIFNACGDEDGMEGQLREGDRILHVPGTHYFQRRNVFVVSKVNSLLSQEAQDYISKEPK